MSNSSKRIILIDDDKLIHLGWKFHFKEKENELLCFFSVEDCLMHMQNLSTDNTLVFIDSDLGDGIKGEVEAKRLYDFGLTDIFLSTGYSKTAIQKPDYIKEILSKKIPDFI